MFIYLIFVSILLFHSFVGASRMRQLDKDMLALSLLFESLSVTMDAFMFFFPIILI